MIFLKDMSDLTEKENEILREDALHYDLDIT